MSKRRWAAAAVLGCGCASLLGVALVCGGVVAVPTVVRGQAALRERTSAADAAPSGGDWVDVDGLRMHVRRHGPADGPAVVLVHGSAAWSGTWDPVAQRLGAAGLHAVALDLPPFGFSDRPADHAYDTRSQAERILGVIAALSLEDVTLVGHSFGGLPTVEAAITAEHVVGRLVLIDVALGLQATGPSNPWVVRVAGFDPLRDLLVAGTFTNPWFIPTGLRTFAADDAVVTDAVVARYRAPLRVMGTTDAIGRWLPELVAATGNPAAADPASYGTLTMPTAIMWGAADTATPLSQGQHLQGLIPGATLTVLDGVGHLPQIEDPDAVAAAIVATVAREPKPLPDPT